MPSKGGESGGGGGGFGGFFGRPSPSPIPPPHLPRAPQAPQFRQALAVTGAAAVLVFALFQKKLLPLPVARIVARVYFYPTIPLTMAGRLGNWWTQMDDTVVLGGAPLAALGHPDQLYKLGVRGVVNMCEEYGGPMYDYGRLGIKQLRLPTVDHVDPDVDDIVRGVQFIRDMRETGARVLVHCKAGHGRSSAVVMAWLLSEGKEGGGTAAITPETAQMFMLSKRRVRRKLYKQACVLEFYERLNSGRLPWQQERRGDAPR